MGMSEGKARLIALSKKLEATDAAALAGVKVNDILVAYYESETGCKDFRDLKSWGKAGFKVKKGSKGFPVWGKPKARKSKKEMENKTVSDKTEQEAENGPKFWPVAYLFNESQVEEREAKKTA